MGPILRAARPGDEAGILAGIHALAVYEREPDAVENTVTALARDPLRSSSPARSRTSSSETARSSASRSGSSPIRPGPDDTASGWRIFIVDESQRGRGYGKALIASLAEVCVERAYSRLEWTVLDWNSPAIAFYRSIGAEPMSEWTTQRLTGTRLAALANPSDQRVPPD